ncbi:MAG: type III-A CRISPR-associated protein Csm2 [Clostridiales bacterium]|nr:type III-A CRISPR-associated protein Csm2 [Clostridiales bacterium]
MEQFKNGVNTTNYADEAERVVDLLEKRNGKPALTTSQIRNILARGNEIYNIVRNTGVIDETMASQIRYLEVRLAYDSGRERLVRDLCDKSKLNEMIKEIGNDKEKFLLFHRYLESIVAYHRFKGGND